MKHSVYQNAVEHLELSDSWQAAVLDRANAPKCGYRALRMVAVAAVMVCIIATSVFAVSPEFRDWTVSLLKLGVSEQVMQDAKVMEFRHEEADGYSIHYLELD